MYQFVKPPETPLERIDSDIEESKRLIGDNESLERLCKNPDFKKVFLTTYLEVEPARLTTLLAHPGYQTEEGQAVLKNQLLAISLFSQFVTSLMVSGSVAKEDLLQQEQTREAILREED